MQGVQESRPGEMEPQLRSSTSAALRVKRTRNGLHDGSQAARQTR